MIRLAVPMALLLISGYTGAEYSLEPPDTSIP
jgi:hypothetical protein